MRRRLLCGAAAQRARLHGDLVVVTSSRSSLGMLVSSTMPNKRGSCRVFAGANLRRICAASGRRGASQQWRDADAVPEQLRVWSETLFQWVCSAKEVLFSLLRPQNSFSAFLPPARKSSPSRKKEAVTNSKHSTQENSNQNPLAQKISCHANSNQGDSDTTIELLEIELYYMFIRVPLEF